MSSSDALTVLPQRPKNLGSRVALLPGKFLRIWKVFARRTEKNLLNCPNTFKMVRIFPDDFQFSGWFQSCPDFSIWLPIFRIISKLSGFFQMTANFPDYFKTVRIFPDDCQFYGLFQNCPYFSRWLPILRIISKLSGFSRWMPIFQIISKLSRCRWKPPIMLILFCKPISV